MTLQGRRWIDGFKSTFGRYLRLPSPPYGNPAYWSSVYHNVPPQEVLEWGDLTLSELLQYTYRDMLTNAIHTTTLAETIQLKPSECGADNKKKTIMVLGCGYSQLGHDLASLGYHRIVQVDVCPKVISDMRDRFPQGDCIEDDATTLSAFDSNSVNAIMDKGLLDTLFLDNQEEQMHNIMKAALRVLKPNGIFCTFSYSQPKYLLPKLVVPDLRESHPQWSSVQVRKLDTILLYKCQKAPKTKLKPKTRRNSAKRKP